MQACIDLAERLQQPVDGLELKLEVLRRLEAILDPSIGEVLADIRGDYDYAK